MDAADIGRDLACPPGSIRGWQQQKQPEQSADRQADPDRDERQRDSAAVEQRPGQVAARATTHPRVADVLIDQPSTARGVEPKAR